ncbi:MAG: hypothetical protein ACKVVT_06930 [Dehalococcoidia bacterium]
MGMFRRLFGGGDGDEGTGAVAVAEPPILIEPTVPGDYDQAVLVYLEHSEGEAPADIETIEGRLTEVIARDELGKFEGSRANPNGTTFRMYGSDAKKLFAGIEEVLLEEASCAGARVVIRTGGPGAPEREVRL